MARRLIGHCEAAAFVGVSMRKVSALFGAATLQAIAQHLPLFGLRKPIEGACITNSEG
jgi:hypothetical protein